MVRFVSQSAGRILTVCGLSFFAAFITCLCAAQGKPASDPDTIVLSNGDTLHGTIVNAVGGKVKFHNDPLGDVSIPWEKIKELHTAQKFAVLDKTVKLRNKEIEKQIPAGTLDVAGEAVTIHGEGAPAPIPIKNAEYIVDQPTLNRQLFHEPSFLAGWNGGATAGATLVKATQNQSSFSGGLSLIRAVPSVPWLIPRNRTLADVTGSYGKITEAGTPPLKSAIFHAEGERDQYFSARLYALGQVAFDHNFSQNLQLQQIYGGGLGWTALKTATQEVDLKGTLQYERQQFIQQTPGANQDLIGSTFSLSYALQTKLFTFTQGLAYIPAYNNPHFYSANETNLITFPTYKNLGFSVGTIDSYLNGPPPSIPPTKRNSFQFIMGVTYAIKSKY